MAENENTQTTEVQDKSGKVAIENPLVIPRNKVDLALGGFRILKGKRENTVYQAPVVTEANLDTITQWLGKVDLAQIIQNYLKRAFQNIHFASISDEDGKFNEQLFIKYGTELSAGTMKLSEINDKLDELMAEAVAISDRDDWDSEANRLRSREISRQIKAYRQMKEDRSKKKDSDEEAAPAVAA